MKFRVIMNYVNQRLLASQEGPCCMELFQQNLDIKMKYKELIPPIFLRNRKRETREDSSKTKLSQNNKFRFINQQGTQM